MDTFTSLATEARTLSETQLAQPVTEPLRTLAPVRQFNATQLSNLAVETAQTAQYTNLAELYAGGSPVSKITANQMATVQSTNDPADVEKYADSENISPENTNKAMEENWFPINVNIPSNRPAPTDGSTPMTEDEKRKRTILIASGVLLVLIVLVAFISLKKKK